MSHALLHGSHYLAVIVACLAAVRPLAAGRWTWRAPRTAIVLWQALAGSLGLSLVGLCLAIGLAPYRTGELRALLRLAGGDPAPGAGHLVAVAAGLGLAGGIATALGWQFAAAIRLRARHRSRLSLVAEPDPTDPALVHVDHPAALAYCLPGRGRTMVVSSGAVGRLDRDQLAAVLDHERAHLAERHDLVLLPFAALRRALPRSRLAARAYAAVSLLVEMRADDLALRRHPPGRLAAALRVFGGAGGTVVPDGALGIADPHVSARLERLDRLVRPPRSHRIAAALAVAATAVTASTPVSLYLLP